MGQNPRTGSAGAGVRVRIRVRPGASRTAVGGAYDRGDRGGPALVVAVTAGAVDGAATAAAVRAVAAALGVRAATVSLVSGATGRDKVVLVDPAPADLPARLAALLDGGGPPA
jgi:uncharacterized protein YggU (UPF0235/DUF167 family)